MKPLELLNEGVIRHFLKSGTVADVETCMNTLILSRKHMDIDAKVSRTYSVKLNDSPDGHSYEVASHSIGLEAIRNLTRKHNIKDAGFESENSKFIVFFSEEN